MTAPKIQPNATRFEVPSDDPPGVLTTRRQGEEHRLTLEKCFETERPEAIEIAFDAIQAVTISYADAFVGRFLTELVAAQREPVTVTLSGLTEDTGAEIDAVLGRRKLLAAAVVDGTPTLLGADSMLRLTFTEAVKLGSFRPNDLAERLHVTVQNANNRLKRLVQMGALRRRRSDPATGGREYLYEAHQTMLAGFAKR